MTKSEICSKDFYDIKVFSYNKGCIVTVSLDSEIVWDIYQGYEKMGIAKEQFETFWDFLHAVISYNA